MLFAPEAYYAIQDIARCDRDLVVVMEADNRPELERFKASGAFSTCGIYKEQGEELYRLICERAAVVSGECLCKERH